MKFIPLLMIYSQKLLIIMPSNFTLILLAVYLLSTVPCSVPSTSSPNSFPHYKPIGSKKDGSFNVEVVKAIMKKLPNGKVEFERLEQTFVSLDDSCANVGTVNNAVELKWGPEYMLVTADGLEIDDSAGTQGKPFV